MSVGDFFRSAFNDDKILGGVWNAAAGPSDAEKAAKAAQDAAVQRAADQLALQKQVYLNNNSSVDQAMQQIFGGPAPGAATSARGNDTSPGRELGGGTFGDNGSPRQYGDDNYYGGGTQAGDLSVGGVADTPTSQLVPYATTGQTVSDPFENSNISGLGAGGTGGGGPTQSPGLVGGFDTAEKGQ